MDLALMQNLAVRYEALITSLIMEDSKSDKNENSRLIK
jgi:hypothetical protein